MLGSPHCVRLFFAQLRVSCNFAEVNHSFPSCVTLLQLVKGLRNLLEAERLIHHGPNLNRTKTTQNDIYNTKLCAAIQEKHASKGNRSFYRAAVK